MRSTSVSACAVIVTASSTPFTFTAPVPQPKRTVLKPLLKEQSWSWDMGEKKSMWVQLQASFRIEHFSGYAFRQRGYVVATD